MNDISWYKIQRAQWTLVFTSKNEIRIYVFVLNKMKFQEPLVKYTTFYEIEHAVF